MSQDATKARIAYINSVVDQDPDSVIYYKVKFDDRDAYALTRVTNVGQGRCKVEPLLLVLDRELLRRVTDHTGQPLAVPDEDPVD